MATKKIHGVPLHPLSLSKNPFYGMVGRFTQLFIEKKISKKRDGEEGVNLF